MLNLLTLCVIDEVRRQVTAIKLHALDNVEFIRQAGALFDRDNALFTDLLHGFGDDLTNFGIGVSRDTANLRDRFFIFARFRHFLQLLNDRDGRFVDTALEVHRVHASRN